MSNMKPEIIKIKFNSVILSSLICFILLLLFIQSKYLTHNTDNYEIIKLNTRPNTVCGLDTIDLFSLSNYEKALVVSTSGRSTNCIYYCFNSNDCIKYKRILTSENSETLIKEKSNSHITYNMTINRGFYQIFRNDSINRHYVDKQISFYEKGDLISSVYFYNVTNNNSQLPVFQEVSDLLQVLNKTDSLFNK